LRIGIVTIFHENISFLEELWAFKNWSNFCRCKRWDTPIKFVLAIQEPVRIFSNKADGWITFK